MRIFLIVILSVLCGSAFAETIVVEASHDNSLYESAQGALSNGAGTFLFAGLTEQPGRRRALVAFKDLSDIPTGATITSVKFHLYLSKQKSAATTLRVMRLLSDWGEGTSDAMGPEGAGSAATVGDATWNHTFFDNQLWTNQGGDFDPALRAQVGVDAVGAYMIDSTSAMVADVQDWLDNPAGNFGWILLAGETNTSARRFNSREHSNPDRRPMLEIEYTTTAGPAPSAGSDWSGPWFDPGSDGEGYLVFNTPVGWLIYYFGYSRDGDRLWLVSNIVDIENLVFGQNYEFSMLVGTPGTFNVPTPSADLEAWGTLQVLLSDCATGVFNLNGLDGVKSSNVTKIVGVEGTSCAVE
jgi:hypothetical protein